METVSEQDVADVLTTTLNWKATGRDQIPNFWFKQLTATHKYMAVTFNKLTETGPLPEWLTAAITFRISNNENTENPKNYRLVSCLPTAYRLLTSIMSRRMQTYMDDENLLPKNRNGAAEELKGARITCCSQKQFYKTANERRKI